MIISIDRLISAHSMNGANHTQRVEIDSEDIKDVTRTKSYWHEEQLCVIHFRGRRPSIVVKSSDYDKMKKIVDAENE